ncbi:MAG: DUF1385 domain-containing protein [Ruminococcus sp.]|nr:DUF1385 domain-containing protein [Ruminococcus sp.]MBQ7133935.1 DUF1385 domain-containing protein [Ruminococcus sp.]
MANTNERKITSIGGSALIEGIMMRGPKRTTVAVRTGENEIHTEDINFPSITSKSKFFRLPIIRGICGLIDSMRLSYKALSVSADKALEAGLVEEEEPSKFEKWLTEKLGDNLMKVIMVIATVLGVLLAVGLFFFLPSLLYDLLALIFPSITDVVLAKSVFEGVLKIALFLGYIILCSQMEEMKRVFMYHGAEHKTIFCYEEGLELTVENIKKQSRFHPRCGTSFLVITLLIGVVLGLFIPAQPFGISILRPVFKLLLLPIMIGIGYEAIKLCGKYDNKFTRILAKPGMWAQHITTKEPDKKMIEVAIEAMTAVIPDDGSDIVSNCCDK